jgi:hypothetical protein
MPLIHIQILMDFTGLALLVLDPVFLDDSLQQYQFIQKVFSKLLIALRLLTYVFSIADIGSNLCVELLVNSPTVELCSPDLLYLSDAGNLFVVLPSVLFFHHHQQLLPGWLIGSVGASLKTVSFFSTYITAIVQFLFSRYEQSLFL